MVTPVNIGASTFLGPISIPVFGRLTVEFLPEPDVGLGLAAGKGGAVGSQGANKARFGFPRLGIACKNDEPLAGLLHFITWKRANGRAEDRRKDLCAGSNNTFDCAGYL